MRRKGMTAYARRKGIHFHFTAPCDILEFKEVVRLPHTTLTGKRQITIPAEICRILGLKSGDKLEVSVSNGEIHMRPVEKTTFRPFHSGSGLFKTVGIASGPGNLSIDHDQYLDDTVEAGER